MTNERVGTVSFFIFVFALAIGLAMMIIGVDYSRYLFALAVMTMPFLILSGLNSTLPRPKS